MTLPRSDDRWDENLCGLALEKSIHLSGVHADQAGLDENKAAVQVGADHVFGLQDIAYSDRAGDAPPIET